VERCEHFTSEFSVSATYKLLFQVPMKLFDYLFRGFLQEMRSDTQQTPTKTTTIRLKFACSKVK